MHQKMVVYAPVEHSEDGDDWGVAGDDVTIREIAMTMRQLELMEKPHKRHLLHH